MGLFRSDELLGIAGETLSFALNAAEETHPREYMGYLRTEEARAVGLDRNGQIITDILVIPGTTSDNSSATVDANLKPNSAQIVGSVHSHPSGVLRPSQTDLETFRGGEIHIILGAPYNFTDWQAFDSDGNKIELDVLQVDLPDAEEFFDITQEDIDRELDDSKDDSSGFLSWLWR